MNEQKQFKIGILGAGQLGSFIADKCAEKEISWCLFYEKDDDPGFVKYKSRAIKLNPAVDKRKKQLEKCETIILENEFYSFEELKAIKSNFIPDIKSYQHFYGKINQRKFYQSLGLNCPKFWVIQDISELDSIDQFPIILKRNLMSYDGLGNRECKNHHELHTYAVELGLPLLAEEKLEITTEFAVGLVSNGPSSIELPLTETFFKNHICHYVIGPYQIEKKFELILKKEIDKLLIAKLKGFFAFEFFITSDHQIIINEGAARPHNSQHLTMNLCDQSQFDYIVNLALDSTNLKPFHLKAPLGAMINLLGKKESIDPQLHLAPISSEYKYSIYMYGKKIGRVGRKLGHLNILSKSHNKTEFTKTLDEIYEGYYL